MLSLAARIAEMGLRRTGDAATYDGATVYGQFDFDIALYPRGFQSGVVATVNMAVFLRSVLPANPKGETFTLNETEYTITQIVPEESDTELLAVLFE